ncbi:hypothetical protein G6O67_006321 [Ophiocordyceps sinensis]|uniref:Uncharacterized protein n=2 Tax=Ophiocordyceps sinensis TaxID=72228 RepID=A0A8H4LVF6_9HYPO|nr:hypothetical protein OCS_04130 [Ophiocordyceps sinensis CO18]KAF4506218.1 hypothetical protein G6O67_006321 [Ophiocordyceps sinensis]
MRPSLEENNFLAEHGPVSQQRHVSHQRHGLVSADEEPDISEDDSPYVSEVFYYSYFDDPEAIPEEASPDGTCRFDDEDAVVLYSDSELDWENDRFDYDVVFEAHRGHVIPSEPGPGGAPVFRAFAARLARQIARAIANQARALHGQTQGIYNGRVARAEQAGHITQLIAREAERAGFAIVQEAQRLGNEISRILNRRWPDIMSGMDADGWTEKVAQVAMQAAALMPMLERQMTLGKDKAIVR